MKTAPTRVPAGWHQPTPWGKLKAIPVFGLLNVIVRTAEAGGRNRAGARHRAGAAHQPGAGRRTAGATAG